jgi:hypothetical protein
VASWHFAPIGDALKRCSWNADPVVGYAHTGGRKLRFSRIKMLERALAEAGLG